MDHKPASYQVIPRKYRPQTFASIVGQEAIVTTLKNALLFQRLAHAYLFCGCRGTGKTTLARVFAKALNCQHFKEDQEPCNTCSSCLEVMAGRSLDVLEIDGASNRGIDDIRQINETVGYAPASGKFKIYIIDEVHMLTKEAFNALLKTLEEPPVNVKFFFATTEPHKVLPTIISRCQRFDLNRISLNAMQRKLSWIAEDLQISCDTEALCLIAHLSEGCLRDAESLLDQVICYAEQPITLAKVSSTLGLMPRSAFFELDQAVTAQNPSYAFELAQSIFSSGKDLGHFVDNLVEHYRTLLHIKLGRDPQVFNSDEKRRYSESASLYTEEQCLSNLDYLVHWQQQMAKTPFKRISLEMILLHLIRSKNKVSLTALVRRLVELEQSIATNAASAEKASGAPITTEQAPAETALPVNEETSSPVKEKTSSSVNEEPALPVKEKTSSSVNEEPALPVKERTSSPVNEETSPPLKEKTSSSANEQPKKATAPPQSSAEKVSLEEALLKKVKGKIEEKAVDLPPPTAISAAIPSRPGHYETLIRFAAVELEGVVKKES